MKFRILLAACLLILLCDRDVFARKWSDKSGKFSVEAELVNVAGGIVTLRRSDGNEIRLSEGKLSEADQRFLRTQSKQKDKSTEKIPLTDGKRGGAIQESDRIDGEQADKPTQTVIAEGSGTDVETALKDAFRGAVGQVVGAVVDAETLVKNDAVIEDKILTYSSAYVKTYDRISEKTQEGLVRVKIRATVERRNLIVKLKAEKVTTKSLDGKSLFAEVVTKLEEEKGAEALLRKALDKFPGNCIDAEVIGKPEVVKKDDEKATIRITVEFKADPKACKAFGEPFQKVLEEIARDRGEFVVTARSEQGGLCMREENGERIRLFKKMPKAFPIGSNGDFDKNYHGVGVALNTLTNKLGDRSGWRYFILDASLQTVLNDTWMREPECRISLRNADGEEVLVERFNPSTSRRPATIIAYIYQYDIVPRGAFHSPPLRGGAYLFSSFFFRYEGTYDRAITVERDLTLTLEELKTVSAVKCELSFSDPDLKTRR